eukprot:3027986-Ditylum_brightwellii.AAC.1
MYIKVSPDIPPNTGDIFIVCAVICVCVQKEPIARYNMVEQWLHRKICVRGTKRASIRQRLLCVSNDCGCVIGWREYPIMCWVRSRWRPMGNSYHGIVFGRKDWRIFARSEMMKKSNHQWICRVWVKRWGWKESSSLPCNWREHREDQDLVLEEAE